MNWVAIIVATVAAMVIGFLWYGPVFGKSWMTLSGRGMGQGTSAGPLCADRARGIRRSRRGQLVHQRDRMDHRRWRRAHRALRGAGIHRDRVLLAGALFRPTAAALRDQRWLSGLPGGRDGSDHRIPRRWEARLDQPPRLHPARNFRLAWSGKV